MCKRGGCGSHPEGTIIGGAEHFGLVGGGDDSESINCPHVTGEGPDLLFRLNVPHLERRETHLHHHQVQTMTSCPGGEDRCVCPCVRVSYVDEVFVGATDDVVVGDGDGVDAAPAGLEDVDTLQRADVPDLTERDGKRRTVKTMSQCPLP